MSVRVCHLTVDGDKAKFSTVPEAVTFVVSNSGALILLDDESEHILSYADGRWLEAQTENSTESKEDEEDEED